MASNGSLLLVSASIPGENGVGCNYLRDFCAVMPHKDVVCCVPSSDAFLDGTSRIRSCERSIRLRYECAWRYGPAMVGDLVALAAYYMKTVPWSHAESKHVLASEAFSGNFDLLVVLESPQLILMADMLRNGFRGRMSVIVWDHVDYVVGRFGHSRWPQRSLRKAFHRVVRRADTTISVSRALAADLNEINPSAQHLVAPSPVTGPVAPLPVRHSADQFVIGFAGSVTAPNELEGLMRALDSVDWRIGDSNVILRLFGPRFVLSARTRRNIQYAGFLPTTDEARQQLSECDVCFLPQPFGAKDDLLARFSFPTKLTAYLAAGRPILIHAPSFASIPSTFPPDHPDMSGGICDVGMVCTDPDCSAMISLLKQLAEDPNIFRQCVERIDQTRRSLFSPQHLKAELNRAFATS